MRQHFRRVSCSRGLRTRRGVPPEEREPTVRRVGDEGKFRDSSPDSATPKNEQILNSLIFQFFEGYIAEARIKASEN